MLNRKLATTTRGNRGDIGRPCPCCELAIGGDQVLGWTVDNELEDGVIGDRLHLTDDLTRGLDEAETDGRGSTGPSTVTRECLELIDDRPMNEWGHLTEQPLKLIEQPDIEFNRKHQRTGVDRNGGHPAVTRR